jgi:hypothetical protein
VIHASSGGYRELSNANIIKMFTRWRTDPVCFINECIEWEDGEQPTHHQIELFTWLGKLASAKIKVNTGQKTTEEERKLAKKLGISIRSGHGCSKTASLALAYYWLLSCFPDSLGYVTASTSLQLESVLWKEFHKWRKKSKLLTQLFTIQSDKVFHNINPKGCFVQARTTNLKATEDEQGETLAGLHSPYMIHAVDEASSIPYGVFKPLEGTLTGLMNFLIMISNPTRTQGFFFDSQHKESERWICLHWNSEESPLVPTDLLENDRQRYGRDSNWYRVRRLGEFPISEGDTLIPYEWVESAINRDIVIVPDDIVRKGLDPGAGGDETVLLTRVGHKITEIQTKNEPDTERFKVWLLTELQEETRPFFLYLDPIGIGNHLYFWLTSLNIPNMIDVYGVDVRYETNDQTCFRLRDELFMKVRRDFETRTLSIPYDDELIGELTTIRSTDPDSTKGKIKIESKRELRNRGLHSPNKADALALTYYLDDKYCQIVLNSREKKKTIPKEYNWRTL